tara:strand:+ start:3509 stop:3715 length:207 start_codon:yes stop_codon:yes gene_type:complete
MRNVPSLQIVGPRVGRMEPKNQNRDSVLRMEMRAISNYQDIENVVNLSNPKIILNPVKMLKFASYLKS